MNEDAFDSQWRYKLLELVEAWFLSAAIPRGLPLKGRARPASARTDRSDQSGLCRPTAVTSRRSTSHRPPNGPHGCPHSKPRRPSGATARTTTASRGWPIGRIDDENCDPIIAPTLFLDGTGGRQTKTMDFSPAVFPPLPPPAVLGRLCGPSPAPPP